MYALTYVRTHARTDTWLWCKESHVFILPSHSQMEKEKLWGLRRLWSWSPSSHTALWLVWTLVYSIAFNAFSSLWRHLLTALENRVIKAYIQISIDKIKKKMCELIFTRSLCLLTQPNVVGFTAPRRHWQLWFKHGPLLNQSSKKCFW